MFTKIQRYLLATCLILVAQGFCNVSTQVVSAQGCDDQCGSEHTCSCGCHNGIHGKPYVGPRMTDRFLSALDRFGDRIEKACRTDSCDECNCDGGISNVSTGHSAATCSKSGCTSCVSQPHSIETNIDSVPSGRSTPSKVPQPQANPKSDIPEFLDDPFKDEATSSLDRSQGRQTLPVSTSSGSYERSYDPQAKLKTQRRSSLQAHDLAAHSQFEGRQNASKQLPQKRSLSDFSDRPVHPVQLAAVSEDRSKVRISFSDTDQKSAPVSRPSSTREIAPSRFAPVHIAPLPRSNRN